MELGMEKNTDGIPEGNGELVAHLVTNYGVMVVALDEARAPETVANFVGLATGSKAYNDPRGNAAGTPYYDGTIFHRVIPGFMLQGGDPTGTGRGGPGFTFADEFHDDLCHDGPGVLSMANRGPNTNGSQFFVCQVPCPHLDGRHAVFGRVVEGLEVIDRIAAVPSGPMDRPVEPVVLERVEVLRR
jgi:peptidyl-prolyl cis-trans isomerase A (cyclophilin A)